MSRTIRKKPKTTKFPESRQIKAQPEGLSTAKRRKTEASSDETFLANELSWKDVTPAGGLDDAEGFYGLEEVDGIEVIRHGRGKKQTRFRTLAHSEPSRPGDRSPIREVSHKSTTSSFDDEEWAGFSDEERVEPRGNEEDIRLRPLEDHSANRVDKRDSDLDALSSQVPYSVLGEGDGEDGADVSAWSSLDLSERLLSAISNLGFSTPTPIQAAVIPHALDGHDVIGKAVTGSGKTLAFAIPIFEKWLVHNASQNSSISSLNGSPISLIFSPTRELAHQLSKHFESLVESSHHQPNIVTVTGGLSIHKQQRQLANADVIIGTPGRLWEVINGSQELTERLRQIRFLVIDEADRLLSDGHFKEVEEILVHLDRQVIEEEAALPSSEISSRRSPRQTLVFSATFQRGLHQKCAARSRHKGTGHLTDMQSMDYLLRKIPFREPRPKFIDVNPSSQMAYQLKEGLVECPAMERDICLYCVLVQRPRAKILIFTNSISSVRRLTPLLQNLNLPASALHSNMPQKARLRSVERFTEQKTTGSILIATDVAARGHIHPPVGRTARADKAGESILLCSPNEVAGVTKLVAQVHRDGGVNHLDSIQLDRNLATRLRPRLVLSQRITNATIAKEKTSSQNSWLRTAAEELGVLSDFDSDNDELISSNSKAAKHAQLARRFTKKEHQQKDPTASAAAAGGGGGGGGANAAIVVSKPELNGWKAQLRQLLSNPIINMGVSERYLAGGAVDVDALLDATAPASAPEPGHKMKTGSVSASAPAPALTVSICLGTREGALRNCRTGRRGPMMFSKLE